MIDLDQCNAMLESARKGDTQALGMLADKLAESGDVAVIQGVLRRAMYMDDPDKVADVLLSDVRNKGEPSQDLYRMLGIILSQHIAEKLRLDVRAVRVRDLAKLKRSDIFDACKGYCTISKAEANKLQAMMQRFGVDFAPEPEWTKLVNGPPKKKKE